MADSFFGFNTTLPEDDGGGGGGRDEEEQYDALNDETFGAAISTDWEKMHEKFVRLDKNDDKVKIKNESSSDDDNDSDFELNFSRVGLEDCDITQDEIGGRLQLDPSVWSSPAKSILPHKTERSNLYGLNYNAYLYLKENFSHPFNSNLTQENKTEQIKPQVQQDLQRIQQQSQQNKRTTHNLLAQLTQSQQQTVSLAPLSSSVPKMCTVEDIERSIRNQQQSKVIQNSMIPGGIFPPQATTNAENVNHSQIIGNQMMNQRPNLPPPPPGMQQQPQGQPPQMNHQGMAIPQFQYPPNRMAPPGFPPIHMMGQQPLPPAPQLGNMPQRHMPPGSIPPISMVPPPVHPNFGNMRHPLQPPPPGVMPQMHDMQRLPMPPLPNFLNQPPPLQQQQQPPPPLPHFPQQQQNMQNFQNSTNQFNQRLVQEIQQNHPLLVQLNRNSNPNNNNNNNNSNNNYNSNRNNNKQNHQYQNHRHDNNSNEYDEYANLMSTRDKQWLIWIQLMQLNTDTPYIDDFYYTVYKDRKKQNKSNDENNKIHKENSNNNNNNNRNQRNHHAQLLMFMGKNGTNQRNGHHNNRERKNSENSSASNKNEKDQQQRSYALQFENSLGKLQCGSVTAPRKVIDMDVVGSELPNSLNSNVEISVQRRSRQLLMHIETLYKIVLKMEDLNNPTAVAAAAILREKREQERQLALKQAMINNDVENNGENELANSGKEEPEDTLNPTPETFNELLNKLLNGLTSEKITSIMSVRKGKTLMRRIMPLIRDQLPKWNIWCDIFSTLPTCVRKDPTDSEGYLFSFYTEFNNQIQFAGMEEILKISKSMISSDKKLNYVVESKFCISSIITMIMRVEKFYNISNELVNNEQKNLWLNFLKLLSECSLKKSTKIDNSKNENGLDNEVVSSLISHLNRFDCDEELNKKIILNILTQNKD